MVEAKSGDALWDANVKAVSEQLLNDKRIICAYKVQYKEWGARFTEWVKPSRVVEPMEHNRLFQVRIFAFVFGLESEAGSLTHTDRRSFSKTSP